MYTDLLHMGKKEIKKKEQYSISVFSHNITYLDCHSAGIEMLSQTTYQHFANKVLKLEDLLCQKNRTAKAKYLKQWIMIQKLSH